LGEPGDWMKSGKAGSKGVRGAKPGADGCRNVPVSRMLSRVSAMIAEMEELRDQLAFEEARQANRGKPATTVNDLRRQRGLPEL
jgi:hypothetical protein